MLPTNVPTSRTSPSSTSTRKSRDSGTTSGKSAVPSGRRAGRSSSTQASPSGATSIDAEALGIDVLLSVADCGLKRHRPLLRAGPPPAFSKSSGGTSAVTLPTSSKACAGRKPASKTPCRLRPSPPCMPRWTLSTRRGGSAVRERPCRAAAKLAAGMIRLGFEPCLSRRMRAARTYSPFLHPFRHVLVRALRAQGRRLAHSVRRH